MSAASAVGADVETASKILGAALGAVALFLIVLTLRRITDQKPALFLAAFFVATSQLLAAWIPSGIDTALSSVG